MFIGYFTERPYQDPDSGYFGMTGRDRFDLGISNGDYNPALGAELYNRYLDEKVYAEEMGFDGVMLNEHHSTPFCMGSVINVEAAILARITKRVKIVLAGNVLPLWDDPLFLAESLAEIDMISRGRLVAGWVRGGGRESISHNASPPYNWERFQEAHDFVKAAWTRPGPFRWEGEHYNYRYVNPFVRPYQKPHPQMWIPGVVSRNTVEWAATQRYPYIMLATELEPTQQSFAYYHEVAAREGYESGTQNIGYLFKVHVDETEELAFEIGRKFIEGPPNPFLEGNTGRVKGFLQRPPGISSRTQLLPTAKVQPAGRRVDVVGAAEAQRRTYQGNHGRSYEDQVATHAIITGTPKSVIPKVRMVLETLRPGSIFLWDGDGAMSHEDSMRSLKLMGEEVLPALREMGDELELFGPFERDAATGEPIEDSVGEAVETPAGLTARALRGVVALEDRGRLLLDQRARLRVRDDLGPPLADARDHETPPVVGVGIASAMCVSRAPRPANAGG